MDGHNQAGDFGMRQRNALISLAILLVIGLHTAPFFRPDLRKQLWPFLDWTMYKDSRGAGPIQANKRRIVGATARGDSQAVTPYLIGSSAWALLTLYTRPMWAGDSSAAQQLFRRLNLKRQDPFVELRLESERYTVTETGIVKQENPDITYQIDP